MLIEKLAKSSSCAGNNAVLCAHQNKGLYVDMRFFDMLHSKHACLKKTHVNMVAKYLACLIVNMHVSNVDISAC